MCLRKCKAVAHSDKLWMQYIEERWSHFQVSKTSHGGVCCFTGKNKNKKREKRKKLKRKIVLKMYRSSPIFWLFTACFIKYFDNVDVYTLHDIRVPPVMHKHVQYGHS